MKTVTIVSLLLFLASPVFGQLTKEDMRAIIKEEVPPIVKEEIAASEKRMKEYIDLKIETVNARIDAVDQKLTARIDGVEKSLTAKIDAVDQKLTARVDGLDKRMDSIWRLMMGLFGLVAATIAIPQIIIAYRDRGRKDMQLQIDQLRAQIEAMQQ